MANEKIPVGIPISGSYDPRPTNEAAAGMKKVKHEGDDLKKTLEELGYTTKTLKESLVELLAVAELFAQFKEGAEQIHNMESAMIGLQRATEANGHNFEEVKGQIEEFAEVLKQQAGIDDDTVIPAMIKLYNATGDVTLAMTQARIAADLAVQYNKPIAETLETVERASLGVAKGLREYGIKLDENLPKEKVAAAALEALSKAGRNASSDAKGLKVELAILGEQFEDLRNAIVEKLLTAFVMLANGAKQGFVFVREVIEQLLTGTFSVGQQIGNLGKLIIATLKMDGEGMRQALDSIKMEYRDYEAQRIAISKKASDAYVAIQNDEKARTKALFQDTRAAVIKAAGDRIAIEKETDEKLTQQLIREGRERYLAEVAAEEKRSIFLQKIRIEALTVVERERKRIEGEEKTAEQEALSRAREQAKQIIALKKLEAQQGIELAQQSVALLGSVFGDSKEIAIAQAIINTYEGATKALSQGGIYGAALAAIVIAAGLAQVAKIESTSPGSTSSATGGTGFDDMGNDSAASAGGRRWARDMVRRWEHGAQAGFNEGVMGGGGSQVSSTVDNRQTSNFSVVMPGIVSPQMVRATKGLYRSLETVGTQVEGARVVARRK